MVWIISQDISLRLSTHNINLNYTLDACTFNYTLIYERCLCFLSYIFLSKYLSVDFGEFKNKIHSINLFVFS